jgi:hypothetical protein
MEHLYDEIEIEDKKRLLKNWYDEIYNILDVTPISIDKNCCEPGLASSYISGCKIDIDDLELKLSNAQQIAKNIMRIKPILIQTKKK